MATIRVSELLSGAAATLRTQAADDLFYLWLEELYALLREKPWAWNTIRTPILTYAPSAEDDSITFTWTEGTRVVQASDPLTLPYSTTGRMVQLGDEWYRVVDYRRTNGSQFRVERDILGSETTGVNLEFVRGHYVVPSNKIHSVFSQWGKLARRDSTSDLQSFSFDHRSRQTGPLSEYIDRREPKLEPPAYPLSVVPSGAGAFDDGTYLYFATRYDLESGAESAPGPVTTYTSVAAFAPNVTYNNPSGVNVLEGTSNQLRIYRSQKFSATGVIRTRGPMYLLVTQDPTGASTYKDTNVGRLYNLERYYDGPWAEIELCPYPDARYSMQVERVNTWGRRPDAEDMLDVGDNNEIFELFRQYASALLNGAIAGDAEVHRRQMASVRSQMAYLLTQSRQAASRDVTPGRTYRDFSHPMDSDDPDHDLFGFVRLPEGY